MESHVPQSALFLETAVYHTLKEHWAKSGVYCHECSILQGPDRMWAAYTKQMGCIHSLMFKEVHHRGEG